MAYTATAASNVDEFVVVTNAPQEVLDYKPSESFMIAFGIDEQNHENYAKRSLGNTIKLSCLDIAQSFLASQILPEANTEVFVSSDSPEPCSLEGIKRGIKQHASKVGSRGLLVVFLSGHGVNMGDDWGFAPGDYDRTRATVLSAGALLDCLQEADCKAKYILIILDCCYSGAMAMKLTGESSDDHTVLPHTYVLAAGTASETSLAINSLGYTIFTYFLRFALDRIQPSPGCLLLSDLFEECRTCAEALSSLVIRHDKELGLRFGKFTPSMSAFEPQTRIHEAQLDSPGLGDFVWRYFKPREDKTQPPARLHPMTTDWLRRLSELDPGPLTLLEHRDLFTDSNDTKGRVLMAVITLMVHSVASIELVYNSNSVSNPNLFLLAFVEVIATLDRVHLNIQVTFLHLKESLPYYLEVLAKNKLDCRGVVDLYQRLSQNIHGRRVETDVREREREREREPEREKEHACVCVRVCVVREDVVSNALL